MYAIRSYYAATNATGNLAYDAMSGDVSLSLASRGQTLDFNLDNLDIEGLARQDGNGSMFGELRYNASYGSHTLGGVGGRVTVSTLDNLIHDDVITSYSIHYTKLYDR